MIKNRLSKRFKGQDERTMKAQKNIVYSFGIKGVSVLTYLLLVPVTLNFLNPVEYGVWLTLSSILMWINTFDIGLGNGLRNKLAEALAKEDFTLGRVLVSTTYGVILMLMLLLFGVFWFANNFIDWNLILNVDTTVLPNLKDIVFVSFALFCLTFVLKLVGNIYLALQKPAVNNLLVMLGQLLSLMLIYVMSFTGQGSLFSVAVIYSVSPVIVYLTVYPYTFWIKYKSLAPSFKLYKKEYVGSLFSLGGQFFILQIGGLVIFSTSNLIISSMFGPENVTVYNIAYRYYSVVPMLFSIVLTPLWSATTDAYVRNDLEWIHKSMKKVHKLILATFIGLFIMTIISDYVYKIWVGAVIKIPFELSISMGIYIYILVISLSYSSFLNGIGKLRVQVINIIFAAIIFLPFTYFFSQSYGILGVVIALIIVNGSGAAFNYIQFGKIIKGTAKGIWLR
ncbi:hypothetical protein FAZ15_14575 [Sphingobacterium olei]|uniref:Polysaccharide biosynthesis protein n=1 Tax=Sphingobacterium olei TaxID=2571155 RepID=A0A4U0NZ59_9SPHI|nr:oligosaccharide flippase family protein [Sphingobacterium olei]TJZ60103.1 hypothetical protein FAZ15_14575 [Sphingobacterium olei]